MRSSVRLPLNPRRPHSATARRLSGGLTLVELMVAMSISLLIALAGMAALTVARVGFSSVDASSQLRDNARYAIDILQRLGVQTGFVDSSFVTLQKPKSALDNNNSNFLSNPPPNVFGLNNASRATTDAWDSGTARTDPTGSDILVLRYQTASGTGTSSANDSDSGMIDCAGNPISVRPVDLFDRVISILHVSVGGDNEPSLMCSVLTSSGTSFTSQPLLKGVENFQVLYGVDGVGPANTGAATNVDTVAERYLRADQLTIAGNPTASYINWRQVRSIRIGMVLRSPPNSGRGIDTSSPTLYPLGIGIGSSGGTVGSAFSSANDTGTVYAPSTAAGSLYTGTDGRLRQVVTFTIHLRNAQVY